MTDPTPSRDLTAAESFGYRGNPWTLVAGIAGPVILVLGFFLASTGVLVGAALTWLGLVFTTVWVLLGGIGWYLREVSPRR